MSSSAGSPSSASYLQTLKHRCPVPSHSTLPRAWEAASFPLFHFTDLFLTVLGLPCCVAFSPAVESRGYSPVVQPRLRGDVVQ